MAGNGGGGRAGVTRAAYGRKFCRVKFFGWIAVCAAEIISHRMKRLNVAAPKENALARKRALIRSLIEKHGWSSTPIPAPRNRDTVGCEALPPNVIPFPTMRK
jgi:hypothetical protein